eukprot:gene45702-58925_t
MYNAVDVTGAEVIPIEDGVTSHVRYAAFVDAAPAAERQGGPSAA